MVAGKISAKQRRGGGHRKRESAYAGKEMGEGPADSRRGVTGEPRRLLLRGEMASDIKGTDYSVPVASV